MPAVMVSVVMTVMVDTMVEMRKAVAEGPMAEKSMAKKSMSGHAMTMAGAATGDGVALRESDEQKKVETVASDLVDIIGLNPRANGWANYLLLPA